MNDVDEKVAYVENEILSPLHQMNGFTPFKSTLLSRIMVSVKSASRGMLEIDNERRQIIPYIILRKNGKIFTYKRAGSESRLYGSWSCGVGGHWRDGENLHDAICRELEEETDLTMYNELHPYGFVHSNETEVDSVHFGLVFILDIEQPLRMKAECSEQKWQHPKSIRNLDDFENWSKHVITTLRGE